MHRVLALAGIALSVTSAAAAPGRGPLPENDIWPRTKEEYLTKEAEPHRGVPLPELIPELWKAAWDRMTAMAERYTGPGVVFDDALAEELIAELWMDNGYPALNNGVQHMIVDYMCEVARWPQEQLPDSARQRLIAGLMEYVEAGGGRSGPGHGADVAQALGRLGGEQPEVRALADALLVDDLIWAAAVESDTLHEPDILMKTVLRACARQGGPSWRLRAYDVLSSAKSPAEPRPRAYEEAVKALRELAEKPAYDGRELNERLRKATAAALVDVKDQRLNDDLLCRLMIACQALLEQRPVIPDRAASYIENQLLLLVSKEHLRTPRHWELWSDATESLGGARMSRRMKRFVQAQLDKKDLAEPQRKALEALRPLLADE